MKNIILLIFDVIILPITILRLCIIYFCGSRYNIKPMEFLDIMMHAEHPYFNQTQKICTIDTIDKDFRISIYNSSKLYEKLKEAHKNQYGDKTDKTDKIDKIKKLLPKILNNFDKTKKIKQPEAFSETVIDLDNAIKNELTFMSVDAPTDLSD